MRQIAATGPFIPAPMRFDASACPLWLYKFLPFPRWWPMVNCASLKSGELAGLTGIEMLAVEEKLVQKLGDSLHRVGLQPRFCSMLHECDVALPNGEKR
ncbi:MAG: hypothetical protein HXY27_09335 [Hydrogenophilaceae bacterium]|nr:hypothetical protein [Hydrogenophilaceae bacterium]